MTSKLPKVSICIPTYNQAQYLEECVEGALNQTFKDIEVVVSVNHCTDDTTQILGSFCDSRLKIVKPDRFLSTTDNFAFCVAESHGPYFNFISSDDVLLPEFVESQYRILNKYPNVAFVHSAAQLINGNGKLIGFEKSIHRSFVRKGSEELKRYIYGPKCAGNSSLIRRSAFIAAGGFGNLSVNDWELWIRLLLIGDVAYNEKIMVKYREWYDKEGERKTRYLSKHLESIVALYNIYQPVILSKHPDLEKIFAKARRRIALSFINGLDVADISLKKKSKLFILQLSNSWSVRLKLFSLKLGLGPIWMCKRRIRLWARQRVKSLLYPIPHGQKLSYKKWTSPVKKLIRNLYQSLRS